MKSFLLFFCLLMGAHQATAQTEINAAELTPAQQKQLLENLSIDSSTVLSEFGAIACKCIDSISLANITADTASRQIAACIDRQVEAFDLTVTMLNSLKSNSKKIEIVLNNNKKSDRYTDTYRLLEKWLRDSCKALERIIGTDNKESDFSFSKDPKAMAAYNEGVDLMKAENYKDAIPAFEKAVKIDDKFVFAWDNIGVCSRRSGDFKKALKAYNKSLEIEPNGTTALQNIPIVYEYLKEYDKALEAYRNIEKADPKNPEAYFGAGRIYTTYKNDLENGLNELCKAYNLYIAMNSPYRVDAEKLISEIFSALKKQNKEDVFNRILKENNISVSK